MNITKFWNRVKSLLKEKGITQEAAAKYCDVPVSTLRCWMTRNYYPPLNYVESLSRLLGITVDSLIKGREKGYGVKLETILKQLVKIEKDIEEIKQRQG